MTRAPRQVSINFHRGPAMAMPNLRSSPKQAFAKILSLAERYPVRFGMTYCLFKTSFSDLMAQKFLEDRDNVDWRRNASFALFGCFYLGAVQYFLYVPVFTRLFPHTRKFSNLPVAEKFRDTKGMLEAAAQVFLDQFIHHPIAYFPVFYSIKELVTKDKPDLKRAVFEEYAGNMKEDCIALWKLWVPTTLFSFIFLPLHLRIPWSATTSLVWTIVLSSMRGKDSEPLSPGEGVAASSGSAMLLLFEQSFEDTHIDPVDADPRLVHSTITVSGPDKKHLIARVSSAIMSHGGNVTVTKMNRLGSQILLVMNVSYSRDVNARGLQEAVKSEVDIDSSGRDMSVSFNSLKHRPTLIRRSQFVTGIKLETSGEDTPGVVADFANLLSTLNCNIERLDSYLKMRNGKPIFYLHVEAGADREFTPEDILSIREETKILKDKYQLTKCNVGILRHNRVELDPGK